MTKKPKKMSKKRLFSLVLVFSLLGVPLFWSGTQLISANEETGENIGSSSGSTTQVTDPSLDNVGREVEHEVAEPPASEPLIETIDRSALKASVERLEETLQVAIANRWDKQLLTETQQMLDQARELLQQEDLTQEKLEEVLLQIQTQNETLTFLNKRAEEGSEEPTEINVGTRATVDASNQGNGDVVFGDNQPDVDYAKKDMLVEKIIDYDHHTINWTVYFNRSGATWNWPYYYVVLPKSMNSVNVTRELEHGPMTGGPEESATYGANSEEFYKRILQYIPSGHESVRLDLETWRKEYLDRMIVMRERSSSPTYKWTFTTHHTSDTNLDKVPIVVGGHGSGWLGKDNWPRGRAVGPFGAALRHDLQKPTETIWVKNKNQLTTAEKEKVREAVVDATLLRYRQKKLTPEEDELTELYAVDPSKIQVSDTGAVSVRWQDDTQSVRNDIYQVIKEVVLEVSPETQEVMEQAKNQEIKIKGIGPDFMIENIQTENLPNGLKLARNSDNTHSITGTISDVAFPEGEETVDYTFKVKAPYTNDTDRLLIEKDVTITVNKNPVAVPVGTHDRGYQLPVLMLALGGSASLLAWLKLRTRGDQIEW